MPVRPRGQRAAVRLLGLVALALSTLACPDGARPSYTRVEGRAPAVVGRSGAILVVFWATWCPPCREELPGLRALARAPPAPLTLVTFGEDEDAAAVRDFFGGPPPPELGFVQDAGGRAAAAFGVDVLPATFLVVEGELVARFSGQRDWNSRGMRQLLAKLAREASPPPPVGSRPGIDGGGGAR